MIKCPKCGKEYRDDAVFCTDCGIRLHETTAPTGENYHNAAVPGAVLTPDSKPLSMWDFFLMELVTKIPILRIVLYCVWGFSQDTNENRKNWSRAQLIWLAIGIVFFVICIALLGLLAGTTATIIGTIADYLNF